MTATATPERSAAGATSRRRLVRVLLVLLVAVALVYVVAVGYVAAQIRSDVFAVRPWPPTTAEVVAVDDDRITVRVSERPGPSFRRDVRYGLRWDDGYGEVSGAPVEDGARVTRDFELLRGPAPEPGTSVTLDRSLVDDDAVEPLVTTEEVTYPSGRGELPALFAEGTKTTWAVLVHGKGESPEEMLRLAQATTAAGLPTLAIGYRNDPGTPPDPSGRHAFGQTEWRDLEAAVAFAQDEGAQGVVLGGSSMGGGIVAAYLENAERETGLVKGVVLDAPMLDLSAVVDHGATRVELPAGLQLPGLLVDSARQVVSVLDDVDWDAVTYVDDTAWLQVPALVLHTVGDTTVPVSISRELAAQEPDLVNLEEFDGEHVEAYNADPERYLATVGEFLESLPS